MESAYFELAEEPVDDLVQDGAAGCESDSSVGLVCKVNDGPVVGTEEQRAEGLLVELEDELDESARRVLLDLHNVLQHCPASEIDKGCKGDQNSRRGREPPRVLGEDRRS